MKAQIIAIFCIFLFVSLPLAQGAEIIKDEDYEEAETGDTIAVNVRSYEPTILTSNLLEDGSVPVYVFLAGSTLGTLLNSKNNVEPLYGNIKIEKIRVKSQNVETNDLLAGDPKWSAPNKVDVDNLGYLTVTLKQFSPDNFEICSYDSECDEGYTCDTGVCIPKQINLSFTADIWFSDAERLYSLSKSALVLPLDSNEETWIESLSTSGAQYGFFGGRGYVRVKDISGSTVDLTVYSNKDLYWPIIGAPRAIADVTLKKGETSDYIDLGYTDEQSLQNAKFRVTLNDIKDPAEKRAVVAVTINGARSELVVTEGQTLFPGSTWTVKAITTIEGRTGVEYTLVLKDTKGNTETIFTSQSGGLDETESVLLNKVFYQIPYSKGDVSEVFLYDTGSKVIEKQSVSELSTTFRKWMEIDVSELVGDIAQTNKVTLQDGYTLKQLLIALLPPGYFYSVTDVNTIAIKKFGSEDPCVNAEIYTPEGLEDVLSEVSADEMYDNTLKLNMLCNSVNEFTGVVTDFDDEVLPGTEVSVVDQSYFHMAETYEFMVLIDGLTVEQKRGAQEKALEAYQKLAARNEKFQPSIVQGKIQSLMNDLLGDVTSGSASLEDNGQFVYAELISIQTLTQEQKSSAVLTKDGLQSTYYIGDRLFSTVFSSEKTSTAYNWYVYSMNEDSVQVRAVYVSSGKVKSSQTIPLSGNAVVIESTSFKAKSVDLKKEAYLTITPGSGTSLHSTSNFSVHIPIESRAFDLNPDKIDNKIAVAKALQESLDGITETLSKIVKTWNYVCLGVFAFVSLKSSFVSASAQARHDAVHGVDDQSGWGAYCEEQSSGDYSKRKSGYKTYDECMLTHASEITNDIQAAQDAQDTVDAMNSQAVTDSLSDITSGYDDLETCQELLGSHVFLDQESQKDYAYLRQLQASGISSEMQDSVDAKLESYDGDKSVYQEAKQDACNSATDALKNQQSTLSELSGDKLKHEQQEIALGVYETVYQEKLLAAEVEGVEIPATKAFPSLDKKYLGEGSIISVAKVFAGKSSTKFTVYSTSGSTSGKAIEVSTLTIEDYQGILEKKITDIGGVVTTKASVTGVITEVDIASCTPENKENCTKYQKDLTRSYSTNEKIQQITADNGARYYLDRSSGIIYVGPAAYSDGSISETWASGAKVEIYASGEYKGLPYCLPYKDGNFIKFTEYTTNNGIDTIQLWNVGDDGQLCTNDDVLIAHESELHYNTASPNYNTLVTFANKWVKKTWYENEKVNIDSHDFTVSYGKSKSTLDGATSSCFDVMNPGDCKLLFNTCDPVMCPPSRFNMGGRWQVDSVVESGIIGSVILPQGSGDYVPLCLTGILASLNFWKSMLDGYVECLEAAKYEGKSVGICDKVRSLYTCEILVRELAAITDNNKDGVLDFFANKAYGRKDSGGGEYFKFKENLQNVQNSVTYFTTEYATTAFAAFKGRSLEEIGTTICQQAIYAQGPWFADFLDQVTTPEDPNQFYATLTVKPYAPSVGTNSYQTYYHVYAGVNTNIPNVVYNVYLKNSLTGEVYYTTEKCNGVSASLELGGSSDQTLDCLFPEGLDTVCVVMNGETNCGFGSVTTAFAMNSLKDSIVADEVQRNITTEEECYPSASTASPTASSLASFGATDSLVLPYSYGGLSTGIQRVCALQDPGLGQGSKGAWTPVGSCGKDNDGRSLGYCWLNTESFSIHDAQKSETASKLLETRNFEVLKSGLSELMDEEMSIEFYSKYEGLLKSVDSCSDYVSLVKQMQDLYDKTLTYQYAAAAQYQLGIIYMMMIDTCGLKGRTQISYEASLDGIDIGSYDRISFGDEKYKSGNGDFVIGFSNLLDNENPVIIVDPINNNIASCSAVSNGEATCTATLEFTSEQDEITVTISIERTDAEDYTQTFTFLAGEESPDTGFASAGTTCQDNCAAFGFYCSESICNEINPGCFYQNNFINDKCFACSDLDNNGDLGSTGDYSSSTKRCAALSDDKDRCTSKSCYSEFLSSGKSCYWDSEKEVCDYIDNKDGDSTSGGGSGVASGDCIATGGADAYENALLDMIASTEGEDYNVLSGGDTFDISRCNEGHPYYWPDKKILWPTRTAWDSGRYQFISSTYKSTWEKASLGSDFCAEGQDKGALYIIKTEKGITSDMIKSAYEESSWDSVLDPIAKTWYGIPYSKTDCITEHSPSRPCGGGTNSYDSQGSAQPKNNVIATFDKCYKEHAGITSSSSSRTSSSGRSSNSVAQEEYLAWNRADECDPKVEDRLNDYYVAGGCDGIADCSNTAWSGAFISYVLAQAGMDFPFSCKQSYYFSEVRDNPDTYDCETYRISDIGDIQDGDILCKCSDSDCPLDYDFEYNDQDGHCDIVVDKSGNTLSLIGGNLGDTIKQETVNTARLSSDYYGFISCGA